VAVADANAAQQGFERGLVGEVAAQRVLNVRLQLKPIAPGTWP